MKILVSTFGAMLKDTDGVWRTHTLIMSLISSSLCFQALVFWTDIPAIEYCIQNNFIIISVS